MLLHASYISKSGGNSIIIMSPDADVFVIGIALTSSLGDSQLSFHTGKDENLWPINLQAIAQYL